MLFNKTAFRFTLGFVSIILLSIAFSFLVTKFGFQDKDYVGAPTSEYLDKGSAD